MHFVHRVRTIWSWLPAFRAVAEAEHLPTAAKELGIVPSSISRTVKQLEDELGIPLFDRTSKVLVLNQAGRTVLGAVREAMRIVDDAVGSAIGDDLRGHVGMVGSRDFVQALLMPAAALLGPKHPALVVSTAVERGEAIADLLLRGDADAAVLCEPPPVHADLRADELASWTRSVYASHAAKPSTPPARCVVVGTPALPLDDGWPSEIERHVVAWAPDERAALELCSNSDLVTVAFDAVAKDLGNRIVRVEVPMIAPRTLCLVHRRAVGRHRRTDALIEAIRACARVAP